MAAASEAVVRALVVLDVVAAFCKFVQHAFDFPFVVVPCLEADAVAASSYNLDSG